MVKVMANASEHKATLLHKLSLAFKNKRDKKHQNTERDREKKRW